MTQFLPRGREVVINPVESDVDTARYLHKIPCDC